MTTESRDIIVVGAGTAGCFAAATAAQEGMDVLVLERKTQENAGYIPCADAIKGTSTFPDVIDREYLKDESFTNQNIRRGIFGDPGSPDAVDITFHETTGAVVDRKRYGEVLIEEAERLGADIQYETVVNDVIQDDDGTVVGVKGVHAGDHREYRSDVVIDGTGALSILQEKADFSGTHFDTDVQAKQFCAAYREVLQLDDPVDYHDAIVFKPTAELGYLWYFPRTPTEINVGLGYQMTEEPVKLAEELRRDIKRRPEFRNATVKNKLGAAVPTRRPFDSAVAPGFIAAGDAAGHVNPTTGGGIPGAAKAGTWAAQQAVEAISNGDVSEPALWDYNAKVMRSFGKRFAAMDLYNIWGTAHEIDELVDIVTAMPGQQLIDALGKKGTSSFDVPLMARILLETFGHWKLLYELYHVHEQANDIKQVYNEYPSRPDDLHYWQDRRDAVYDKVYDLTGADPKY